MSVHKCNSRHAGTKAVVELFRDQTAWSGDVEIFNLLDHPKAKRCYAWAYDDNGTLRTTAVLEIPPVDSAETAVKIAIAAKAKTM